MTKSHCGALLFALMFLVGCGNSVSETGAPEALEARPTTTVEARTGLSTSTTNVPEPLPTTSSTAPKPAAVAWPEWVQALPFDIDEPTAGAPDALAFADEFRDPGLNYKMSIDPTWDFSGSQGTAIAPNTEWKLDDTGAARIRLTSVPIAGTPFPEFVSALNGNIHYADDELIVSTETIDDEASGITFAVIKLYRHSVDRIAFAQLSFPVDTADGHLKAALPYLLTFERTPWNEVDQGSAPQQEVNYWLAQFDSMSAEDLARYGTADDVATCIADGFRSDRIERYAEANLDAATIDSSNPEELAVIGNFYADQEELAAFCGMPPNSFGTLN